MSDLSEFWYTEYTMSKKYGYWHTEFELFGPLHWFWLIACVVFTVVISVVYRKASEKVRKRIRLSMAMFVLLFEISRIIMELITDQWHVSSLPIQLCSIGVFICTWHAVHPNKLAGNLLYALSMPGAALAMLSPSWTMLPLWNFNHLNSELGHIVLFSYPVMLIAGGFRPELKELPKVLAILAAMCVAVTPINEIYNTNFFFLGDPYGNVITSFCTSIFGENLFVIGYAIMLAIVMAVLYAPFVLINLYKKKRHRCDSLIT